MADRHTLEELNNCSREELITIVLMMQGQLDTLNENIERLIEQVRIANSYRFGKHAETLDSIDGQLSFFDEAESCCDLSVPEPAAEDGLRPEFKDAMDSYEAFYNEYCEVLKKYMANPSDLSILGKYMDLMGKLSDMDAKFEAWESEDLNAEELKYYMDVNNRVMKKLLDITG